MASFIPVSDNVDVATKLYDNAYQSASNTLQSVVRVVNNNIVKETLQSFTLGGGSSIDLPQNVLLSNTLLTMKFSATQLKGGAVLEPSWGFRAIRYVEYTFANSQPLRYTGRNLMIKNLADCESGEKRVNMMALAGAAWDGQAAASTSGRTATINIYLPFSNMSSSRCIPFDASIMDRPVNIRIEFVRTDELFTYSAGDAAIGGFLSSLPNTFNDVYLCQKTGMFVDGPSDSIRSEVGRGGGSKYSYGYMYPQSFSSGDIKAGVPPESGGNKVSFRLDNFLNGSLQSMDLFLERVTKGSDQAELLQGLTPFNQALYYPMKNIELSYAGNVIYRADDDVSQLINLTEYTTSGNLDLDVVQYTEAVLPGGGATFQAKTSKWTHIQFSQFNETFFSNLIQSGILLVANQVMITFNTPTLAEIGSIDGVVPTGQPWYRLHANYNYQSVVRTANGATELLFNSPLKLIGSQVNTL